MKGSVILRNNVPMTALLLHAVAQWVEDQNIKISILILKKAAKILKSH
jgi:hypothetical protein